MCGHGSGNAPPFMPSYRIRRPPAPAPGPCPYTLPPAAVTGGLYRGARRAALLIYALNRVVQKLKFLNNFRLKAAEFGDF